MDGARLSLLAFLSASPEPFDRQLIPDLETAKSVTNEAGETMPSYWRVTQTSEGMRMEYNPFPRAAIMYKPKALLALVGKEW